MASNKKPGDQLAGLLTRSNPSTSVLRTYAQDDTALFDLGFLDGACGVAGEPAADERDNVCDVFLRKR